MDNGNAECRIDLTKDGLEMKGDCAQGLVEVFLRTYTASKKAKSEIFACGCLNPSTGKIEKAIIGNIGTPRSVSTKGVKRICPENTLQISYHTHPISGTAKFSAADGSVIVDRFNEGYEGGHCVVGDDEYRCVFQTRLKKDR